MGFSLPCTLHAPLSMGSETTLTDVVSFVVLYMLLPLSKNVVEGEFLGLRLMRVLRSLLVVRVPSSIKITSST